MADTGVPKRNVHYNSDLDRWFDAVHIRVGGEGSNLVGVVFSDITERKRAEEALQESVRVHAFQAAILAAMRDPVWATDAHMKIVYWNEAATTLFGWTADEVRGRPTGELFRTLAPGSTPDAATEQLKQTGEFRGDTVCHAKDGRAILCEVNSRVVRGPAGEVACVVNTARDVAERRRANRTP